LIEALSDSLDQADGLSTAAQAAELHLRIENYHQDNAAAES
jgi:putative addiction module component (TIGR02574 family)